MMQIVLLKIKRFKSVVNPSCIDLFVTNKPSCFQNTRTICTGLSDFHKMVVTVFKVKFEKNPPKKTYYRNYKNFNSVLFREELRSALSHISVDSYKIFEDIFLEILNRHAPIKSKILRANQAPYMTKTLRQAIMKHAELKSNYFKKGTEKSYERFRKHRNFCSKLYKKERKKYYNNIDLKQVNDNKRFWDTVKPFLSEKSKCYSKISLVENNKLITDDDKIATCFSNYFKDAVDCLNISTSSHLLKDTSGLSDPIEIAVQKFGDHPSILAIKRNVDKECVFSFNMLDRQIISKEVLLLDSKKNGTFKNIPPKVLKESVSECSPILSNIWNNEMVAGGLFSDSLKLADVSPIFKKDDASQVKNYRPVSVLPTLSKVFERLMHSQMAHYFDNILSPLLCGYRKGHNTQTALINLVEKCKEMLDKKGYTGAILMDLSKAFDTLDHELLLAKLHAYGFSRDALLLINSYLRDRKQRIKINFKFSDWVDLIKGVPQGSVLGPLLFNIYLNDLFYILKDEDICNFADDTTPFVCDIDINRLIKNLKNKLILL